MVFSTRSSFPRPAHIVLRTYLSALVLPRQLGHFFNNASIPTDPWLYERYYSDEAGHGHFGNVVDIGTPDVEGRAFIVHSANGTRVACGLLEKKTSSVFTVATKALGSAAAEAEVTVYMPGDNGESPGIVYLSGMASNLEPNLQGPPNGTDCTAPNGCGVHIHSGGSCFNVSTQGGHFYDNETLTMDPWTYVYYNLTDSDGHAHFAKTVNMGGITSIDGRPFVVHSNNGSRVSCGVLAPDGADPEVTSDTGGLQLSGSSACTTLSLIATLAAICLG
jgi:hypothetical protein